MNPELKETRAQRSNRMRAEREAEQLALKTERIAKTPLRLLKLIARAAKYAHEGVSYTVHNGSTDPEDTTSPQLRVTFVFEMDGYADDRTVYIFGDDWEYQNIEDAFTSLDVKKADAERKLKIAREAFDVLTPEQREALNLRYRP